MTGGRGDPGQHADVRHPESMRWDAVYSPQAEPAKTARPVIVTPKIP